MSPESFQYILNVVGPKTQKRDIFDLNVVIYFPTTYTEQC